jgi:anti-sigma factor RsiW
MDDVELGLSTRCERIVELVTDYLEDALDPAARRRFEAHLAICPPCVEYVRQIEATLLIVGYVPLDDLSDAARADLIAAFRDGPPA